MTPILAAVLLLTGFAPAQPPAEQKEFDMHLYAPFLEPGLAAQEPAGAVMPHSAVEWTSPTEGRMFASLWLKKALVEFQTTADRKSVTAIRVELGNNDKPGQSGFDVWRHRHSYLKVPGQNYLWNSIADTRPALADALGADYDACLAGAWTLWARRQVNKILAEGLAGPGPSLEESGSARLKKKIALRYDRNGLVGTASGDFTIRLWGVPVHVEFEIKGRQPTYQNPHIIDLVRGAAISYGRQEWRLRHGYARGSAWDDDFIENKPSITAMAPRLDDLLDRSARYWADTAVHIILDNLDRQLKDAIGMPAPAEAALALQPSVKTLNTIESGQIWPQ